MAEARCGSRRALAAALLAWLLFLAWQSLAGSRFETCRAPLLQQGDTLSLSDGLANLVAYLPLGMLASAWLGPRKSVARLAAASLAIAGFSLTMELLQACLASRVSSWYDLATNASGGLLGLLVGLPAGTRRIAGARSSLLGPVLLVIGAWLALALAPWRFTLDVGTLRGNLSFLLHWDDWRGPEPWRFARHFFGWLATALALRALLRERAQAGLALVVAIALALAGQLLLVWQALSFDELAAIGFAALVATWMPSRSAEPVLARLLPVLALLSVSAYQLAPGRGAVPGGGFRWLPQVGLGSLVPALELSLLFGWLAFTLVLSLRWRQHCGEDISRTRFTLPAAMVGFMLATEIAQAWIPGRIPDSSAPLLTGLAFLVGWALFGSSVRNAGSGPGEKSAGAVAAASSRDPETGLKDRARPRSRRPAS